MLLSCAKVLEEIGIIKKTPGIERKEADGIAAYIGN